MTTKVVTSRLVGIVPELDEIIHDFAYLVERHKAYHPANSGDVSQVLDRSVADEVLRAFADSVSDWIDISRLETLVTLRNDGRTGYRSEGIRDELYYKLMHPLAGRMLLITRTGADLPALHSLLERGQEGKLLVILEVDSTGRKIRIVYGNAQFGSIPSIETHIHMLANGLSIAEGIENPAMVHAHPFHLITLARDKHINGDFSLFNAALYTQVEGINRNYPGLVAVVPYYQSGSADLVKQSMEALQNHHLVVWMNHGFVARAANIRMGYTLMSYADDSARCALDSIRFGSVGLPSREIDHFLQAKGLHIAYQTLFG